MLRPGDGVWADVSSGDGTVTGTHDTFTAWYAEWLDNAISGNGPWQQWGHAGCAAVNVLSEAFNAG